MTSFEILAGTHSSDHRQGANGSHRRAGVSRQSPQLGDENRGATWIDAAEDRGASTRSIVRVGRYAGQPADLP